MKRIAPAALRSGQLQKQIIPNLSGFEKARHPATHPQPEEKPLGKNKTMG
jgi:hypothetical protein